MSTQRGQTLTAMRRISRSQLRAYAIAHIKSKQNGVCPICKQPINLQVMGAKSDYVVDHDHETGEIRGVLHRSCNAAEGKVANAAGRWGAKSTKYKDIIPWLKNLIEYLESPGAGVIYPDHKTPEEREALKKQRARRARAYKKAREKVKEQNAN